MIFNQSFGRNSGLALMRNLGLEANNKIYILPVSYIFLAFHRFYLSPGVRISGTPGQVLKNQKGTIKLEHAGPPAAVAPAAVASRVF